MGTLQQYIQYSYADILANIFMTSLKFYNCEHNSRSIEHTAVKCIISHRKSTIAERLVSSSYQ